MLSPYLPDCFLEYRNGTETFFFVRSHVLFVEFKIVITKIFAGNDFPETQPETEACMQVVDLGNDARKQQ